MNDEYTQGNIILVARLTLEVGVLVGETVGLFDGDVDGLNDGPTEGDAVGSEITG